MSIIGAYKPEKLTDLPGGLTEVYLDNLAGEHNLIKKFPLAPAHSHLSFESGGALDKEWSQVFDLGDTQLICVVKANELEMRLVHLTDAPLTELKDILLTQNGSQNMEDNMRGMGMSLNNPAFI